MGLFVQKPQTGTHAPLYTLGLNKTVLIVGLGNPGAQYAGTRHNIGFACLDSYAQIHDFPAWTDKRDLKCLITSTNLQGTRVIVIKPTTYMNLSGEAVQAVQHFYKLATSGTLVVHDELDVPFGTIRTRVGGGSAGHNGIASLLSHLGEDFGRIRVGIANEESAQRDSADFVLDRFNTDEDNHILTLTKEVCTIIDAFVATGELASETRSFM